MRNRLFQEPLRMVQSEENANNMSLSDALAEALRVHQEGQLDQARSIYRQILAVAPQNPDALHYLGLASYQSGDVESALAHIRSALKAAPDYFEARNNLGIITQALGQFEEAEACYREVIRLQPEHANGHSNLGVVLKSQGRMREAAAAYREALFLDPAHAQAHQNLGNLLRRAGQGAEAISHYRSAIEAGLNNPDARQALISALHVDGQEEAALKSLGEWLSAEPDNPVALHLRAALHDAPTPMRASDDYVRMIFDNMAGSFEDHLDNLDYQAHTLVCQALHTALGPDPGMLSILDAGCGTGLCGPLVRPLAGELIGIDLSPGMLRRAQRTRVYDELLEGELALFLQGATGAFDAIICADTLCYFGDLAEVIRAAAEALKPEGRFVFTVEHWLDEEDVGYLLGFHGRYSHGKHYIEQVLARSGLKLETLDVEPLRKEGEKMVDGLLITARLPPANTEIEQS